jgi:DNA-binding NarL/FixJ family response regulator
MGRIRVLLADDHTLFSTLLQKLLEPQYEVVGSVEDGRMLLEAAIRVRPDVAVVDISMPMMNGLDAGRALKRMMPHLKLIYLTMNTNPDFAREALEAGASAYLLKNSHPSEVLQAIHDALRGTSYVSLLIRQAMEKTFIRDPKALSRPQHLTDRQREILQMIAEGQSMKEIAYVLHIAQRTVRFHKFRIMEELGISTNAGLVQYAMKSGMISPV